MNKQTEKKNIALKFLLILITLSIVVVGIYLKFTGTNIKDAMSEFPFINITTKVLEIIDFDADSKSSFATLKNSYVQCTKDGIKYNGGSKWNETYTMISPIMVSEGNIIAVYEAKNRKVYVFNEHGKMYECTTDLPIMQISINKSGYLVVITKDTNRYIVSPYDNSGKSLSGGRVIEEEQNYPITADISEDGRYMAICFLDTSITYYKSKLLFIDLSNNGEAEAVDSISASIEKEREIIFSLSYMEDNTLIAISDKNITAIGSDLKEAWSNILTNQLKAIDVSDGKTIVIGLGSELPGVSGYKSGTAVWYDLTGKQMGTYEVGKEIKAVSCKSNKILVYSGKTIFGLTRKGNLLWEHIVLQDVMQMMLFDDLSSMFVVYRNSAQIIDIKSRQNGDEEKESTTNEAPTDNVKTQTNANETTTETETSESLLNTDGGLE